MGRNPSAGPSESKACQEKGGGKEKSDGEKEGGCQEKGARQAKSDLMVIEAIIDSGRSPTSYLAAARFKRLKGDITRMRAVPYSS